MAVKYWKYAKPKKVSSYDIYFRMKNDITYTLGIKDWSFEKNAASGASFTTSLVELDDMKVDKIWSIWDFELKEEFKKHLKKKSAARDTVRLKITQREKDNENHYEVEWL